MASKGRLRRHRLAHVAAPLQPAVDPYYRHVPGGRGELAPGWYIQLPGLASPTYLGASAPDAELTILELTGDITRAS